MAQRLEGLGTGLEEGSEGGGPWHWAGRPELHSWAPHRGRIEPVPADQTLL